MSESPPALRRYVTALAAAAVAVLFAATLLQLREGLAVAWWAAALGASVFVAAFFLLGQTSFTFVWRGHRHRMVLDEVPLFVGLLAIPTPALPLLVAVSSILEQARMKREGLKAAFNLSQNVLASAAAAGAFLLVARLGTPPILAALPAALLYPLVSNFLTAGIFSRLSEEGHLRIFADRFVGPGLLAGAVGAGGGVAVAALWSLHPLTLLALMPFVFLTYRYGVLSAAADRELEVHKRLAEAAKELVGTSDVERASRRILSACGDVFPSVGRAELLLDGAPAIAEAFGPGANERAAPLDEPIPGVGVLRLRPRPAASTITEVEKALVRIVAAQLGAAIGEARALQRLETVLRAAPDAILLVSEGRVKYENPAAQALLGSALPERLLRASGLAEMTIQDARGEEITVQVHPATLPEGTLLIVRDVTQLHRQQQTLARQEKLSALGTLVAGVAHEINNPVNYMRGALELASMDLDEMDVAHARVSLQRLSEGVERVHKITHALKAVARQGNGERAPEDVRAIAEDVAQVVRIGLPRGVSLELDLAPAMPRVQANAAELHQVVLNLVKNASEALGERGGHVKVRAWGDGRDVFVEVADDGPGIPEDVQRRLFEPFFTTKREGTGLGLSVSKGIIEAHGGEMLLRSAPGQGARFTIRLPAAR